MLALNNIKVMRPAKVNKALIEVTGRLNRLPATIALFQLKKHDASAFLQLITTKTGVAVSMVDFAKCEFQLR